MDNSQVLARWAGRGRDDDEPLNPQRAALRRRMRPGAAQGIGLWVFIGVATALFTLFIVAYVMRMSASDATAIVMPWQLWLSTGWLVAGSLLLQHAAGLESRGQQPSRQLLAGGACALAFIAVQGWAWQRLLDAQVSLTGNPAGSFFYLLTTLHGLHVAGGVVAWALVLRGLRSPGGGGWRIQLCARYWHFLLVVWVVLFTTFRVITPEVAGVICGTR